jgi:hypothetical protein
MAPRFAWNCSRGLRTLALAVFFMYVFASFSSLEALYCGPSLDVRAARIRWANARQSEPSSKDPQVCRTYGNQFYEAVEARQAVSECKVGDDYIRVAAHDLPGQIGITLVMPLGGIALDDQIFSFDVTQAA